MSAIGVIELQNQRFQVIDLDSKLYEGKMLFLTGELNEDSVDDLQKQLIYLRKTTTAEESQSHPIQIYINSPGGEVYSALGLYDFIRYMIKEGYVIETFNRGLAASAAAVILLSGSEGHRYSFPNATVMMHQPSSYSYGTVTDMEIDIAESKRLKQRINDIVIQHAGPEIIPYMERDKFLDAETALSFNIIDQIKKS